MTYEELRAEFVSYSFREKLIDSLGKTCCNCGYTGNMEYHHIVPLILGGTNKLTNIVPLCKVCHSKAHNRQVIKDYRIGRPNKVEYESVEDVLDDYFKCKIGKARAFELLCFSPNNKNAWYALIRRYKEENGITTSRNNIVVIMSNKVILANESSNLADDRILGYIKYKDGKKLRFTKNKTIVG